MLPERVILDPVLAAGLPPPITAAVGMDALSHCMEAFSSPVYHPMAQGIGLEGMLLIKEWLPRAYHDGSDIEARAHLQVASTMGATAFQKGLGAMHSLAHPCGAVLNTHHGLTNAVVMPYVMAFNKSEIEDKFADLASQVAQLAPMAVLHLELTSTGTNPLEFTLPRICRSICRMRKCSAEAAPQQAQVHAHRIPGAFNGKRRGRCERSVCSRSLWAHSAPGY